MNKEEILKKVKELIIDYQIAEETVIWECSGEIEKDTKELESKIAELKKYFERALGEVNKMQAIIEGNLYEIEPAVKVILDRVMIENAELKRENKRLEEENKELKKENATLKGRL